MALRQSVLHSPPARPELEKLLEDARRNGITEDQLKEQRVSFAYGNAPDSNNMITKETVRNASASLRLAHA
jgi:hypothetical protein